MRDVLRDVNSRDVSRKAESVYQPHQIISGIFGAAPVQLAPPTGTSIPQQIFAAP